MKRFWFALYLVPGYQWSSRAGGGRGNAPLEGRFTPLDGFAVEEVVTPGETGSLVAMAFDEAGNIIASRDAAR